MENYKEKVRIDENALDLEWLGQSDLMLEISRDLSTLEYEKDKAEDQLAIVEADLDLQIRKDPAAFGIDKDIKITETVIKNTLIQQQEYRVAKDAALEAKYEFNDARGAVKAFDARKSALENLVKLHGQQYFAGPKVPRDINAEREAKEEQHKQVSSKVGKSLKRTKR